MTIDDGPSTKTGAILDMLKEKNVKTTFFVIGRNVKRFPQIVKRMDDEGHEVQSHTMTHPFLPTLVDPQHPNFNLTQFHREIDETEILIQSITGKKPRVLRPPYGHIDQRVHKLMTEIGYTIAMWNAGCQDWLITKTEEIVPAIQYGLGGAGGLIVMV